MEERLQYGKTAQLLELQIACGAQADGITESCLTIWLDLKKGSTSNQFLLTCWKLEIDNETMHFDREQLKNVSSNTFLYGNTRDALRWFSTFHSARFSPYCLKTAQQEHAALDAGMNNLMRTTVTIMMETKHITCNECLSLTEPGSHQRNAETGDLML